MAFFLRVYGANSSIAYIPDTQTINESFDIAKSVSHGDINGLLHTDIKYPLVLPLYSIPAYAGMFLVNLGQGTVSSVSDFENYLINNRDTVRLLTVVIFNLISILLIPALWIASRKLNPTHKGWFAAIFGTFNLLLVQFGHHARPHVPFTTLGFIAVILLVAVVEGKNDRWRTAAVVATAIAIGTLQSGALLIIPLGLTWLLTSVDLPTRQLNRRELMSKANLLLFLLFFVLVLFLYPIIVVDVIAVIKTILGGEGSETAFSNGHHDIRGEMFSLRHIPQFIERLFSYQPLLTLLTPLGLWLIIRHQRNRPKLLIICLSYLATNLLIWSLFEETFARITSQFVPYLILASAYFCEEATRVVLQRQRYSSQKYTFAYAAICFVIVMPQMVNAIRLNIVTARPDTRTEMGQWIVENVDKGDMILTTYQFDKPDQSHHSLALQKETNPASMSVHDSYLLQQYEAGTATDEGYDLSYSWIYLESHPTAESVVSVVENQLNVRYIVLKGTTAPSNELAKYALTHGLIVHAICPGADVSGYFLPDDLEKNAWYRIWQLDQPGPPVFIFDLQQTPAMNQAMTCP